MESITGNTDTDFKILLLLDDLDLENVCYSSDHMHQLCNNSYLWYQKILTLYPDFPLLSIETNEYKALYNKLKYQQWTDIVTWAEVNHFDALLAWILLQKDYEMYFIKTVGKLQNISAITGDKNRRRIIMIEMYRFLHTHQLIVNTPKFIKFKITLINKLEELSIANPELIELFDMYIDIFNH